MKRALSIRQPWAWAIIHAGKDIENRTWYCGHRGELYIHASKTFDHYGYNWIKEVVKPKIKLPEKHDFNLGGIIGKVEMIGCIKDSDSVWFCGPFGFLLSNPQSIKFLSMKGKLKIFDIVI